MRVKKRSEVKKMKRKIYNERIKGVEMERKTKQGKNKVNIKRKRGRKKDKMT